MNATGISEMNYRKHIFNNKTVRESILLSTNDDPNNTPLLNGSQKCFNGGFLCRYDL